LFRTIEEQYGGIFVQLKNAIIDPLLYRSIKDSIVNALEECSSRTSHHINRKSERSARYFGLPSTNEH
jgi:hypothetical protein